ncbi:hypothetical protein ACOMHD_13835, partial [Xanthomonas codiaei]
MFAVLGVQGLARLLLTLLLCLFALPGVVCLPLLLLTLLRLICSLLCLVALLGVLRLAFLLLQPLRLLPCFQRGMRLQRLGSLRPDVVRCLLLQRVGASLRQLLILRLACLLLPLLMLLRGAGGLAPGLHVEHMLVGGRRGGRVRIRGAFGRGRRRGQLLHRCVRLLASLQLLQRLTDVLGAGDRCNARHAVGTALQMGDRAVGAILTAGA